MMINKVNDFINKNDMLSEGDRIVVGVSGGADSVCLLKLLHEFSKNKKIELFVVHVNHGIRGEEADADEQYVKSLCSQLGVLYHAFTFEVKKIAQEEGLSEEEAGRKVRYETFYKVSRLHQCNKIAIAHNKNDSAETVLFHLFRGSGVAGLSGIASIREIEAYDYKVKIIRPLLCVSRSEIEGFLARNEISYQTDSTNLLNDYSRNKIRNQVLTYVSREINQNAVEHITQAAAQWKEIDEYIEKQVSLNFNRLVEVENHNFFIKVEELLLEDIVIQKGLIRKVLKNLGGNLKDLEAKHVELVLSLMEKPVGKSLNLPYQMVAKREYTKIKLYIKGIEKETVERRINLPIPIEIPGRYKLPVDQCTLEVRIFNYEKNIIIPKNSCTKWFDYDKIENTVEIRTRKAGDFIQIGHDGGSKKLKDYFIDQKIPKENRANMLLVADGNHIMWILGDMVSGRMSEKYKVDEKTKRILLMNMTDMED